MKLVKWLVGVLAVVAAGVVLRLTLLAPDPVEVRTAPVERGVVEETVSNTRAGTVKVRLRANLSPQMGGLVVELPYREGSLVAAGTLLLRLDDRIHRARVELARRSVATAEAQREEACLAAVLAEKELVRAAALHEQGIASEQRLDALRTDRDRSRAACDAADAAVGQATAQVTLALAELELTELRAPFAGTIADVSTEVGEWITPSPPGVPIPPVLDLLDPESAYVSAPIDEVDAERVQPGLPARLTVDSRPGEQMAGRVVRVASYVLDQLEQNRTVEIEVEPDEPESARGILPGTSADVEVILVHREGILRIPSAAVAEGGRVLVLEAGVLVERGISRGLGNWQFTEVTGGLEEGQRVVVSRTSTDVKAGAKAVEK